LAQNGKNLRSTIVMVFVIGQFEDEEENEGGED
jgi:hypothetical protein